MRFHVSQLLLGLTGITAASPIAEPQYSELEARQAVQWPPGQSYQSVVLAHHNAHRQNHSAPALGWGPQMFENAKVLAQRCVWQHNTSIGGQSYGQNLAAGTYYSNINVGAAITGGWYGEAPYYAGQYGQATPDLTLFENFGHFTQLVWASSQTVGCITTNCKTQGGLKDTNGNVLNGLDDFTVCNYWPAGNVIGDFGSNVRPSKKLPPYTVTP